MRRSEWAIPLPVLKARWAGLGLVGQIIYWVYYTGALLFALVAAAYFCFYGAIGALVWMIPLAVHLATLWRMDRLAYRWAAGCTTLWIILGMVGFVFGSAILAFLWGWVAGDGGHPPPLDNLLWTLFGFFVPLPVVMRMFFFLKRRAFGIGKPPMEPVRQPRSEDPWDN